MSRFRKLTQTIYYLYLSSKYSNVIEMEYPFHWQSAAGIYSFLFFAHD